MDISTFQTNLDFVKSLYFHEEWKDEMCRDKILEAIEECNEKIKTAFGSSIHTLDKHKPSIEAVEKVVRKFPSTLSHENEEGRLPIHSAANDDNSLKYIPVLAKEGVKYKVGGEDARGGLMTVDPSYEWNTLQCLSCAISDNIEDRERYEMRSLNVLKELRKVGLLKKDDILEQQLLYCFCSKCAFKKFKYLLDWDRQALIETRVKGSPLIHALKDYKEDFSLALETGFRYHPSIGGLLFIENDEGETALEGAFDKFGEEETMDMLHTLLSPNRDFPILHHIFTKTPQYKDLFVKKFPWAYHLRDQDGRSLHQALLAAGPDIMNANDFLFAALSDNQIQEKDPITTLYPFAAIAVGEHADLEKSFYLLRRHPSVLERRQRTVESRRRSRKQKRKASRKKKRKAEELSRA